MRKVLVALFSILTFSSLEALPFGNPSEANMFTHGLFLGCNPPCFYWIDAVSVRIGYYGDFVFNRNLEIQGEGTGIGKHIHKTEINTNAGYLALNLGDCIDIFGTLGASNIILTQDESTFSVVPTPGNRGRIIWTDTRFSWSAGLRGALFKWKCFTAGLEGQFFSTRLHITSTSTQGGGIPNYFNDDNEAKYYETQIGLGVSYTFTICDSKLSLIPYAGGKWARAKFTTDNLTFRDQTGNRLLTIFDMKTSKYWGYAVGTSLTLCSSLGVTVEGRFADETAFYVNGQFRF